MSGIEECRNGRLKEEGSTRNSVGGVDFEDTHTFHLSSLE